jgi:hypothetical protein
VKEVTNHATTVVHILRPSNSQFLYLSARHVTNADTYMYTRTHTHTTPEILVDPLLSAGRYVTAASRTPTHLSGSNSAGSRNLVPRARAVACLVQVQPPAYALFPYTPAHIYSTSAWCARLGSSGRIRRLTGWSPRRRPRWPR